MKDELFKIVYETKEIRPEQVSQSAWENAATILLRREISTNTAEEIQYVREAVAVYRPKNLLNKLLKEIILIKNVPIHNYFLGI